VNAGHRRGAPGSAGVFALAAIPARHALERREWAQGRRAGAATERVPVDRGDAPLRARARRVAHRRPRDARTAIDSLSSIEQRLLSMGERYWAEQVAVQQLGAQAWLDHAEGRDRRR
jgi:hypothetical protein